MVAKVVAVSVVGFFLVSDRVYVGSILVVYGYGSVEYIVGLLYLVLSLEIIRAVADDFRSVITGYFYVASSASFCHLVL
jgi:hypothetical protein